MEFTASRKGNAKLIIGGFSYVRDKIVKNTTYWKCDQFRICRSRVSTTNDRVNKGPSQHTHAPDLARIEAQKTVNRIRERASNSEDLTSNIIQQIRTM